MLRKQILIALGAFFPVLINTISGVRHVDRLYLRAARNLGAGRGAIFLRVMFPAALPYILAGMRIGIGTACRFGQPEQLCGQCCHRHWARIVLGDIDHAVVFIRNGRPHMAWLQIDDADSQDRRQATTDTDAAMRCGTGRRRTSFQPGMSCSAQ